MYKKVLIIAVILLALIIAAVVIFTNRSEAPVSKNAVNNSASYGLEDVAIHNKMADCWTIINGGVYDITNYVPMHPGGDEILLTCGTDGTSLFAERKTDSGEIIGSGTPHSNAAENQLSSYKIGDLAQ